MKSVFESVSIFPQSQMPYGLRPMTMLDISQVAEIEREAFPTMLPATPFKREISNRMVRYLIAYKVDSLKPDQSAISLEVSRDNPVEPNPLSRVVDKLKRIVGSDDAETPQSADLVVGYVSLWYMGEEGHVVSIAAREAYRGKGIGELLLMGIISLAMMRGSTEVTLEVRKSNYTALALYTKYGFTQVGLRKGYYTDNNEDALVMTTAPIQTLEYQQFFNHLRELHAGKWGGAPLVIE